MQQLTEENQARISIIAALCEDMRDIGNNDDREIYDALQNYLNRRWRPNADAFNIAEK